MSFRDRLTTGMPGHFTMPEEFLTLADWIEQQGYLVGASGHLADPDIHETGDVRFHGDERLPWPADYLPDPARLYVVGETGGEGSGVCLWLDDDGAQHVVHHGSGSGSCLWATFPSALAVLRLFAVGYFTPAFNDEWGAPPEYPEDADDALAPYRTWLRERWGQATPATGVEALNLSADQAAVWTDFNGPTVGDPFHEWLNS